MAATDQCALAADGSLLDASAIIFYNDPDDDIPLPSSNSTSTSTRVHPFFRRSPAPSKIVAGSRRSTRTTRPSARITDPNNLEASASAVTRKRSATVTASADESLRAARRTKLTDSGNESERNGELDSAEVDADEDDDGLFGNATTDEEGGGDSTNIEQAYSTTKAMGDADRHVRLKSPSIHSEQLMYGLPVPRPAPQDYAHC
jgi:hypothetical protein